MPRKPMPWFRVYVETLSDVKLWELPPAQRWVWIAVLAAARQSPIAGYLMVSIRRPMTDKVLAELARVPLRDVQRALVAFEANDMIHRDDDIGAWCVSNWASRQFESDDATARSRRRRGSNDDATALQRANNGATSADATCSETETETETEPTTSSSDSRGPDEPVDNHALTGDIVPDETWDAYAEIALRRRNDVTNPVPWKRSTAQTAREQHGTLAALWWHEFELTPRRLAECLMDGQIRNVQRRTTA